MINKKFVFKGNYLGYCFPGREFVLSETKCEINVENGYMFPFHFVMIIDSERENPVCTTLISQKEELIKFSLKKYHDDDIGSEIIEATFCYDGECLDGTEVLCMKDKGNFHVGLKRYMQWYYGHYYKENNRNRFSGMFHLKRIFLHDDFCDSSVIRNGKVFLDSVLKKDEAAFGGIDVALLFDIGYDPVKKIRCGNNTPCFLDSDQISELKKQMRDSSLLWFSYFDPCIVQVKSDWDRKYGPVTKIKDGKGETFRNWGNKFWHPYLDDNEYIHDSSQYISKMQTVLPTDGVYLDEIGNGTQYSNNGYNQIRAEKKFVNFVQNKNPDKFWMCEFPPVYFMLKNFDLVLSDTKSLINIYRFICPWLKFVRVINCDLPLGNNVWEVNKSFFNAEALWLDNNPDNEEWYPEEIKKVIREQYKVLKLYGDIFDKGTATPLVDTEAETILCNRFEKGDRAMLMFINPSDKVDSVILHPGRSNYEVVYGGSCSVDSVSSAMKIEVEPGKVIAVLEYS